VGGKTGHGQLLFIIERAGGSVAQRELQSALGLTPATTSELLGRLESEGLLTRERDARDSRRLVVNLTPLGREQAREKERIRVAFEQRAFTCLSECERETLFDLLETVKTHWEQLDDSKTLEECTRV
jgi:DNA-binding MarR family transcriptional regulator